MFLLLTPNRNIFSVGEPASTYDPVANRILVNTVLNTLLILPEIIVEMVVRHWIDLISYVRKLQNVL